MMGKQNQKPPAPQVPQGPETGSPPAPAAGAGVSSQEAAPAQSSSAPEKDAEPPKPIDDAEAFDTAFGKSDVKAPVLEAHTIQNGPVRHNGRLYRDGEEILLTLEEAWVLGQNGNLI